MLEKGAVTQLEGFLSISQSRSDPWQAVVLCKAGSFCDREFRLWSFKAGSFCVRV